MLRFIAALLVPTLAFVCFVPSVCPAPQYEIVPLGTLGGSSSWANAITTSGLIAGSAKDVQGAKHPVFWNVNGIMELGSPPGYNVGQAEAGNEAGQFAVTGEGSPQSYSGFLWENGTWTDLGVLPGRNETIPADIDPYGRIVGVSLTLGGGNSAAFIWESGTMTNLGTLGGSVARAYGINWIGQVVGWSRLPEVGGVDSLRAFLWENGVMTNLGVLPDRDHSQAFDINDHGDIVGSSWVVTIPLFLSADRATLWRNEGAAIVDLGPTPGPPVCVSNYPFYTDNIARAINNHVQIVGDAACVGSGGALAAFLWDDGVMYNLNDLIPPESGWDLLTALDINDAGEIVGVGVPPGGVLEAFLLLPMPPVDVPLEVEERRFELTASPSPFRNEMRISFSLPHAGRVQLTLHDVQGRRVAELSDDILAAGPHAYVWRGAGESVGSGVYFLRLRSGGMEEVRRVVRTR